MDSSIPINSRECFRIWASARIWKRRSWTVWQKEIPWDVQTPVSPRSLFLPRFFGFFGRIGHWRAESWLFDFGFKHGILAPDSPCNTIQSPLRTRKILRTLPKFLHHKTLGTQTNLANKPLPRRNESQLLETLASSLHLHCLHLPNGNSPHL